MSSTKIISSILVIALLIFGYVNYNERQKLKNQLGTNTASTADAKQQQEADQALAKQIIAKVQQHIAVETDIQPTVATIVDVDILKAKNPFYNNAENGDYLVVTPTRAILFSAKKNKVIDVLPVQIQAAATASTGAAQ